MIDISVNDLVKSFEVGSVLLDGLSFEIHEGECVGIMGRNGCGKTTLFRLLTGELSPDEGEIVIAAGKKLGLISQIPKYPDGYTVEDVLRTAFLPLQRLRERMEQLEQKLTASAPKALLDEYGDLPLLYAGGVMSNTIIRGSIEQKFGGIFAKPEFSSDNAAGIAVLASVAFCRK